MNIYTKRDGIQSGPYTIARILAQLKDGTLSQSDLAWHENASGWEEISKCKFITREIPPELPPAKAMPEPIQIEVPNVAQIQSRPAPPHTRTILFGAFVVLTVLVGPLFIGPFPSVVLLFVIVFLWRKGRRVAKILASTIQGPDLYEAEVVGESHYQPALESICGGRKAHSAEHYCFACLVLEDSNPHDNKAVRVDIDRKTVGYLARRDAREYRQALAEAGHPRLNAICKAVVRGGRKRRGGEVSYFGVWLDLPQQ